MLCGRSGTMFCGREHLRLKVKSYVTVEHNTNIVYNNVMWA